MVEFVGYIFLAVLPATYVPATKVWVNTKKFFLRIWVSVLILLNLLNFFVKKN